MSDATTAPSAAPAAHPSQQDAVLAATPASPSTASEESNPESASTSGESRRRRVARRGHRLRLQIYAVLAVALLVYVVALGASNTRHVRVDWVFGHGSVALIWLVLFAAILGWLLSVLITTLLRWRTRAPRSS